jgi:hypothetical protein
MNKFEPHYVTSDILTDLRKLGYGGILHQWMVLDWLETKGVFIVLLIDGWGLNDECVSEQNICYRIFVWKIGKPRPLPHHDLGAVRNRCEAYNIAIKYVIDNWEYDNY